VSYIQVGAGPGVLAFGDGSVWVANIDGHSVSRIDPTANRVTASIPLNLEPSDLAITQNAIWVAGRQFADRHPARVARLDPTTNRVTEVIPVGVGSPDEFEDATAITSGFGSVWVSVSDRGLVRIDPQTNHVTATIPDETGDELLAAAGSLWSAGGGDIARIDPTTNVVTARESIEGTISDLVTDGTWLWAALTYGAVARVALHTGRVLRLYATPDPSTSRRMIAQPDGLWVTDDDTLRLLQPGP